MTVARARVRVLVVRALTTLILGAAGAGVLHVRLSGAAHGLGFVTEPGPISAIQLSLRGEALGPVLGGPAFAALLLGLVVGEVLLAWAVGRFAGRRARAGLGTLAALSLVGLALALGGTFALRALALRGLIAGTDWPPEGMWVTAVVGPIVTALAFTVSTSVAAAWSLGARAAWLLGLRRTGLGAGLHAAVQLARAPRLTLTLTALRALELALPVGVLAMWRAAAPGGAYLGPVLVLATVWLGVAALWTAAVERVVRAWTQSQATGESS